jgi:NADH-quinone oxidoreductase subunit H
MFVFVWIRGTLLRFRYDQFMKFGWKVLIPAGLGWVVFFAVGRQIMDSFNRDLQVFDGVAGFVALLITWAVWSYVKDLKKSEEEIDGGASEPEVLDAFAGGYPVPPMPHQVLPPSPRLGRTVDATTSPAKSTPEGGADV